MSAFSGDFIDLFAPDVYDPEMTMQDDTVYAEQIKNNPYDYHPDTYYEYDGYAGYDDGQPDIDFVPRTLNQVMTAIQARSQADIQHHLDELRFGLPEDEFKQVQHEIAQAMLDLHAPEFLSLLNAFSFAEYTDIYRQLIEMRLENILEDLLFNHESVPKEEIQQVILESIRLHATSVALGLYFKYKETYEITTRFATEMAIAYVRAFVELTDAAQMFLSDGTLPVEPTPEEVVLMNEIHPFVDYETLYRHRME